MKLPEGWKMATLGDQQYFTILSSGINEFKGEKEYLSTESIQGTKLQKIDTYGFLKEKNSLFLGGNLLNQRMSNTTTAKLHVSPDIAELVKIYCVLTKKKMSDFTTEVLSRELQPFKQKLETIKQI